ncbi:MAG: helix-turn-helix transcriptional regulator, partial [Streptomyces sp.]|nr:helix-turn-helix transcriptional regulator [Streptomyces sp.]NUS12602.1 helix-turn-helix transcriptional regulator [Streptomyces sp.]
MDNKYGQWLKARREAAGLTQQELADAAIMTRTHIAHIEAGRRIPSKTDAQRLDQALGTGDVLRSFLPEQERRAVDYFEPARQLERQATMICEFALSFMPGILQTEAYARFLLGSAFPPKRAEECDRHVVTRLERAKILDDPVS